eukprot:scaffold1535_cov382-Prasinococcus_capsulatus_cf.AAC.13
MRLRREKFSEPCNIPRTPSTAAHGLHKMQLASSARRCRNLSAQSDRQVQLAAEPTCRMLVAARRCAAL